MAGACRCYKGQCLMLWTGHQVSTDHKNLLGILCQSGPPSIGSRLLALLCHLSTSPTWLGAPTSLEATSCALAVDRNCRGASNLCSTSCCVVAVCSGDVSCFLASVMTDSGVSVASAPQSVRRSSKYARIEEVRLCKWQQALQVTSAQHQLRQAASVSTSNHQVPESCLYAGAQALLGEAVPALLEHFFRLQRQPAGNLSHQAACGLGAGTSMQRDLPERPHASKQKYVRRHQP